MPLRCRAEQCFARGFGGTLRGAEYPDISGGIVGDKRYSSRQRDRGVKAMIVNDAKLSRMNIGGACSSPRQFSHYFRRMSPAELLAAAIKARVTAV